MSGAARRLYTRDGTVIVDIEDLVAWAVEHYIANMQMKHRKRSIDGGRLDPANTLDDGTDSSGSQPQYSKVAYASVFIQVSWSG